MKKCKYYISESKQTPIYNQFTGNVSKYIEIQIGRCNGTKKCIEVSCKGNPKSHRCEYYE